MNKLFTNQFGEFRLYKQTPYIYASEYRVYVWRQNSWEFIGFHFIDRLNARLYSNIDELTTDQLALVALWELEYG